MRYTIHEALSKKKLLDKRIYKKINESIFVDAKKNNEDKCNLSSMSEKKFTETAKSNYNSIMQLIKNKTDLKAKIDLSNANTMIEICGEKISVVQAIAMKKDIELKKYLLERLIENKESVREFIDNNNHVTDRKIDNQIQSFLSVQNNADSSDELVNITNKLSDNIRKMEYYSEVDAISINDKIKTLDEEISKFISEIDVKLSISNATTEIELDYDI